MKLNHWSIVHTADKKGLALKPPPGAANHYEACVAVRNNTLEINVYVDGVVAPIATMNLPIQGDEE